MERFSALSLRIAAYVAVGLFAGMIVREYARAWTAARLGDPTPRLWGRVSWNPRSWFDPFGSGLLPGLILVLWAAAARYLPAPFAYGKPAPVDPSYLRRQPRDVLLVSLAGPLSNVGLGVIMGLLVRVSGLPYEARLFSLMVEYTTLSLAIYHLLPIPGLDGARMVALALPPRARSTYQNLDQYLALFALLVIFLIGGPVLAMVDSLSNAICDLVSGARCVG